MSAELENDHHRQMEATDGHQGLRSDPPPPPSSDAYANHPFGHQIMEDDGYQHYTMAEVASERAQQPFKMQVPQARPAAHPQPSRAATHAASSPLASRTHSAMGHFDGSRTHQDDQNGTMAWGSSGTWLGSDEAEPETQSHHFARGSSPLQMHSSPLLGQANLQVMRVQIGGRTRLVKRASQPLLFGPSAQTGKRARVDDEAEEGETPGDTARDSKSLKVDHRGENEGQTAGEAQEADGPVQEDEEEDEDDGQHEFDPTASIVKFDVEKNLIEPWEEMQKQIHPFLREFAETTVSTCMDIVLQVTQIYHQMLADAKKDLEQGVEVIREEEKKQGQSDPLLPAASPERCSVFRRLLEHARETIIKFQTEMARIAQVLLNFGQAPASKRIKAGQ